MIPKKIHYIWFGGKEFGPKEKYCVESWSKLLPDYEIIRWDDNCIGKFDNPYFKQAIEAKQYAFASDYARLKILYEYGGIYLDTDEEVLKPLDCFLEHDFFMGCQSCGSAKGLNPACVGAIPKHPIVKDLLAVYDTTPFVNADGSYNKTTNPAYFEKVLTEQYHIPTTYLTEGRIEFFPNAFLYDYFHFGKQNKTSYATHHYSGSWKDDWKIENKGVFSLFGKTYALRKYKKNRDNAKLVLNDGESLCAKLPTSKRSMLVLAKLEKKK